MRQLLCTICARGNSKGVVNKNIRIVDGKPLIAHTIGHAAATGLFPHIVVSTDSDEIAAIAKEHGAEILFKRPPELSTDTAAKIPVIRHAFLEAERHYGQRFDVLCDLDVTSPLRIPEDIVKALETFDKGGHDILFSVMNSRRSPYFNLVEVMPDGRIDLSKKPAKQIVRRQDAPKCYDANASIYLWRREALQRYDSVFCDKTGIYIMPEERSIDIDSEMDFEFVKWMMEVRRHA